MTTNPSGIAPMDVKVLLFPDPPKDATRGGILLPDMAKDKEKFAAVKATVIAVGANAFAEWGSDAPKPAAGDRVLVAQYSGHNQKGADSKDYRIVNDEDVIALLMKEEA